MKIPLKIFLPVFVSVVAFSSAFLSCDLVFSKEPIEKGAKIDISSQNEYYIIKEYDGKIAVFSNNFDKPIHTLDSPYVRDLPEYDRELLEEGIVANSKDELTKILEDYDN